MNYSGHVRKREVKNGKLTYQIIIEKPPDKSTGTRNRLYRTVHTNKKEAEKIMRDMIAELENKTYIQPTNITVKEWMNEWYDTYQKPYRSESTLRSYRYQLDNYIIPKFGNIPIQDLSTMQVQKWINELSNESPISHKPMSARSVKNIFLNLSAAMQTAERLDLIKKNPCKNVTLPQRKSHQVEVYDEKEIDSLIQCLKGTDMEVPIMLALTLGLRRGELIALRWENVDLDNGIVHICENRVDGLNGEVITKSPKSQAGIRDIPLSASLITMLKKHKLKYMKKQLKYGVGKNKDDYVICQHNGQPYKPFSFTKKFRTFLNKNNLRHIRLHDLRHTNASVMLSQGISPKVAQQRLGHSDFSTTMNIYSHVMKTMETEAAQKLDDVLFHKASV